MPCDNWLGLKHYELGGFKFKTAWLGQQLDALVSANKHALKSIRLFSIVRSVLMGKNYLFLLGIVFYCMIILQVGTRFKTSISLTFMW